MQPEKMFPCLLQPGHSCYGGCAAQFNPRWKQQGCPDEDSVDVAAERFLNLKLARIRSTEERWGVGGLPSELSHQNYYGSSIDPFYISIAAAELTQHAISCHMMRKCDNSPYVAKPFKHLVEKKRREEWLLGDLLHVADKHMHVLCYRGKWEQKKANITGKLQWTEDKCLQKILKPQECILSWSKILLEHQSLGKASDPIILCSIADVYRMLVMWLFINVHWRQCLTWPTE